MAREARPRSAVLRTVRDAVLLFVVAVVLLAGLVHYGALVDGRGGSGGSRQAAVTSSSTRSGPSSPTSTPSVSPTTPVPPTPSSPTATAPSQDPSTGSSTAPAPATPARCWDGQQAVAVDACAEPTGTAGLRWVYPSLDPSGGGCHRAPRAAGAYAVVVGWECFARVDGRAVAITYEQVRSPDQAEEAIDRAYAGAREFRLPGAHGGRCTWFDARTRPVRVTGYYPRFPFVVSLYAPTPAVAKQAWATLVRQRSSGAIRGLPA